MVEEELQLVRLKDDFYRDGFYKALFTFAILLLAIILLISTSIYLHVSKPKPVIFAADNDWRILAPVPVNQPYLTQPDLMQWFSVALPGAFTVDFVSYNTQLKSAMQYFTDNGWKKFSEQLNIYANTDTIHNGKLFVSASPAGAPILLNQGLLNGVYGWWIQMPINLSYSSVNKGSTLPIAVQALVVRVPTLNNLYGVAIDNIIVSKGGGDQVLTNE